MHKILSTLGKGFWGSIAEWYQNSVICELLTYLEANYFTVSFHNYQNFSISSASGITVRNIILGIAIGIIIASAMSVHTKRGIGGFVRKLLRNECHSPESAKTLSELGYFQNLAVRRALTKGVSIGKLVVCKELQEAAENGSSKDETSESNTVKAGKKASSEIDFSTMHFYIPADLRYRADVRFDKAGATWIVFAISLIGTIVGAALMCIFLPDILQLVDNIITWLSPK